MLRPSFTKLNAAAYKNYIFGMLFLKWYSDVFDVEQESNRQ